MRVTNQMMSRQLLRNLKRNMQNMQDYQDELSTGKKVLDPSDGPVAITKVIKYKSDIRALEQYDKNAKDALSWAETSELAINDISSALDRARELAVQAANGTNAESDIQNISSEIEQLKDHIIGSGNKTFAGRYVFSSFHTDEKLFVDDPEDPNYGKYNYDITNYELENKPKTTYEVGIGEKAEVSTNGLDLFGVSPQEDVYLAGRLPVDGIADGTPASRGNIAVDFDLDYDFTGDSLSFEVDGTAYTVDTSDLNGSATELTRDEIIQAIKNAEDGSGTSLSDANVADVYYNADDKLVIESRTYGTGSEVDSAGLVSGGILSIDTSEATGSDAIETVLSVAGKTLTDTDVNGSTGEFKIKLNYNGDIKDFTVDMSTHADVNSLVTNLQTQIDTAFGTGVISVTGSDGNPLSFETQGTADDGSQVPELSMTVVKAQESKMIVDLDNFITALNNNNTEGMREFITKVDDHLKNLSSQKSIIGAKTNRLELILNRISDDNINVTQLLSNAQDVDMSEAIMNLKNYENIYRASLSTGAKVIQPSLIDFLR